MNDLYRIFNEIAEKPEIGMLRQVRSFPFYMASARQHYVVYKSTDSGIIIATILYGRRNIETIIRNMAMALADEIYHIESKIERKSTDQ